SSLTIPWHSTNIMRGSAMKYNLYRLVIASIIVCLVSVTGWTAEQVVKFRKDAFAKLGISARTFNVRFQGPKWRRLRRCVHTMFRVAGVMFTAVAAPAEDRTRCLI